MPFLRAAFSASGYRTAQASLSPLVLSSEVQTHTSVSSKSHGHTLVFLPLRSFHLNEIVAPALPLLLFFKKTSLGVIGPLLPVISINISRLVFFILWPFPENNQICCPFHWISVTQCKPANLPHFSFIFFFNVLSLPIILLVIWTLFLRLYTLVS